MLHQEIQRPLAGLKAHQTALAVELALGGKAVMAVQVAGVGHVQAQSLDHGAALFELKSLVGVGVGGKQLAGGGQLVDVVKAVGDVRGGHFGMPGVFLRQQLFRLGAGMPCVDEGNGIIGQLVHSVNAAAVHIDHNVVAAKLVLMDHREISLGAARKKMAGMQCIPAVGSLGRRRNQLFSAFSHGWLAMPQLVLQALWQEVWHSPQPPFSTLFAMSRVSRERMCFIQTVTP